MTTYSEEEIDEFLSHHGIKGQKWGVRRSGNRPNSGSRDGHQNGGLHNGDKNHQPQIDTHKEKPKHVSEMSTEELQKAITRLDMEKRYSQLTYQPETKTSSQKARKVAGDILAQVGKDSSKQVLTKVAISVGLTVASAALTRAGKPEIAALVLKSPKKDKT